MPLSSRLVLVVVLVSLGATSAGAQQGRMELGGRTLALGPLEMSRLADVRQVLNGAPGLQDRALAAARAVANSPDARYVLALYQLEVGRQRRDDALRREALDVLIGSPDTPPDRLANYLGVRGDIAFRARDFATAGSDWARLAELRPNDPQALMNLAQVRAAQADGRGAIDLIRRATAARAARSEAIPEVWHRQWLSIAFNGRMADQTALAAHALVEAHPTAENWRMALVAFRQVSAPRDAAEIDLLRLMRAARAFRQDVEYQRLAQLLLHAGFLAEARATLEEGLSRGLLNRAFSPTPEIFAEIERATPRPQPVVPPAAAAVRRAAALAAAGDRAGAEAAFRAAANGAADAFYADLARFWLSWLARPAGAS
jgi:tetratricopeptide (TPR) repeat protein